MFAESIQWLVSIIETIISSPWFDLVYQLMLIPIGILIALSVDSWGNPRFEYSIVEPAMMANDQLKHLYIGVRNNPRTRGKLIRRKPAYNVKGTLSVYHTNGEAVLVGMPLRWAGNPEPYKMEWRDNEPVGMLDHRLFKVSQHMNIPPDSTEGIDTVLRFRGEADSFGFNHENYQHGHRYEKHKVPQGEFILRIALRSDEERYPPAYFKLTNPHRWDDFAISEFSQDEEQRSKALVG